MMTGQRRRQTLLPRANLQVTTDRHEAGRKKVGESICVLHLRARGAAASAGQCDGRKAPCAARRHCGARDKVRGAPRVLGPRIRGRGRPGSSVCCYCIPAAPGRGGTKADVPTTSAPTAGGEADRRYARRAPIAVFEGGGIGGGCGVPLRDSRRIAPHRYSRRVAPLRRSRRVAPRLKSRTAHPHTIGYFE
jgi:hypothetical protein